MQENKIHIYKAFVTLLLIVSISFAWMLEINTPVGRYSEFKFNNNLHVAPNDLHVSLFVINGSDEVDITHTYQTEGENAIFQENSFEPGKYKVFVLKLRNDSSLPMVISSNFTNISSSTDEFNKYINIGILSTKGFSNEYPSPEIEDFYVEDRKDGDVIPFISNLKLPPNGEEVEIKYFVKLSEKADNSLSNGYFKIGVMNFMTA